MVTLEFTLTGAGRQGQLGAGGTTEDGVSGVGLGSKLQDRCASVGADTQQGRTYDLLCALGWAI